MSVKRTVTRVVLNLVSSTVTVDMGIVWLVVVIAMPVDSVLVGAASALDDTSAYVVERVVSGG